MYQNTKTLVSNINKINKLTMGQFNKVLQLLIVHTHSTTEDPGLLTRIMWFRFSSFLEMTVTFVLMYYSTHKSICLLKYNAVTYILGNITKRQVLHQCMLLACQLLLVRTHIQKQLMLSWKYHQVALQWYVIVSTGDKYRDKSKEDHTYSNTNCVAKQYIKDLKMLLSLSIR